MCHTGSIVAGACITLPLEDSYEGKVNHHVIHCEVLHKVSTSMHNYGSIHLTLLFTYCNVYVQSQYLLTQLMVHLK